MTERVMLDLQLVVEVEDETALAAAVEDRLARLPEDERAGFETARTDPAEALALLFDPGLVLEGTGMKIVKTGAITGPAQD